MVIFPNSFFLGNIVEENVFHDILEHKKAFLGFKNKGLTHGFGPKMAIFPNVFF